MKSVDIDTAIAELDKALEENQIDVDAADIAESSIKAAPTDLLLHRHMPTAAVSALMELNVDLTHIPIPGLYPEDHRLFLIDTETGTARAYDPEGNHHPEDDFPLPEDHNIPDENTVVAYDLQGNRCPEDDIVIEVISGPISTITYDQDGNRTSD